MSAVIWILREKWFEMELIDGVRTLIVSPNHVWTLHWPNIIGIGTKKSRENIRHCRDSRLMFCRIEPVTLFLLTHSVAVAFVFFVLFPHINRLWLSRVDFRLFFDWNKNRNKKETRNDNVVVLAVKANCTLSSAVRSDCIYLLAVGRTTYISSHMEYVRHPYKVVNMNYCIFVFVMHA